LLQFFVREQHITNYGTSIQQVCVDKKQTRSRRTNLHLPADLIFLPFVPTLEEFLTAVRRVDIGRIVGNAPIEIAENVLFGARLLVSLFWS
jgi:hypothetical protein